MKVAFLMIALIVSVGFRDVFTVLSFYSHRALITEVFCINKDRPELKCNGKCYLAKKIQQEEKQERNTLPFPGQFDHFQLTSFIDYQPSTRAEMVEHLQCLLPEWSGHGYASDSFSKVFHPPEVTTCCV